MAVYTFTPTPAIDPRQAIALATNADGQVFAVSDASFASPLTIVDTAGVSKTVVHVGLLGLTEQFTSDQPVLIWKSGSYVVYLWSPQSMLQAMTAAQQQVQQMLDQVNSVLTLLQGAGGSGGGGVTRHSQLFGLDADDHQQYFNTARGDARYYTQATADNKISGAVSAASTNDRKRSNHTGSQEMSSVTGLVGALVGRGQDVLVSTGLEARPDTSQVVWWIDARTGTQTQPVNMQRGTDVWLAQTSSSGGSVPVDSQKPTAPTGLVATGVTSTGFTVSWTAATDNVGVTGYDVQIGGVSVATPTGTSQVITGRTPATAYTVRVRARDAAGLWSDLSSALTVTTSAGASVVEHSVFGATAYPGASSANIYATAGEIVAQGFRLAAEQSTTWRVKGVRLYTPNVTGAVATTATLYLFKGPNPGLAAIATTNNGVVTMTGITKGGWTEARFATPVDFGYFDRIWVAVKFAAGTYFVFPDIGAARYPATDGSAIGLEQSDSRAQSYDPVAGQQSVNAPWGLDLIVDAGA